ncbi:hypothetical protein TNIN_362441 [Trichonephila inaurata madagascariensis]|uniref:Uncharacterized protein n=1 Tax=Trichonephila inaurata madagascariensis TaxID=2747483 RepID=A0A8X6WRU2_9ARAC|nr:hypothetical protein TNIN_362441 [Trichonephila inaurata madagascariensis]
MHRGRGERNVKTGEKRDLKTREILSCNATPATIGCWASPNPVICAFMQPIADRLDSGLNPHHPKKRAKKYSFICRKKIDRLKKSFEVNTIYLINFLNKTEIIEQLSFYQALECQTLIRGPLERLGPQQEEGPSSEDPSLLDSSVEREESCNAERNGKEGDGNLKNFPSISASSEAVASFY